MKISAKTGKLLGLILLAMTLNNTCWAQWYGQYTYQHDSTILCSAKICANSPGYAMAGFRPFRPTGTLRPDFVIDKVNPVGTFTATGDFSRDYFITDGFPSCGSPTVYPRNCSGVTVIETNDQGAGEAYALVGAYSAYDGTNTAGSVFFTTLDQGGNVINTVNWRFTGGSVGTPRIRESANSPGEYFICANTNYQSDIFVARVDAAGNQIWAFTYNVGTNWFEARDLIESPYNSNDLIVVGRVDAVANSPTAADAFFMKLNAGNGGVSNSVYYNFLSWDSDDWFSCIEPAASTTGGSGYVVGGRAYGPTEPPVTPPNPRRNNLRYTQLMCKLDPNGGIIWDALVKSSAWTSSVNGPPSEVIGVYERLNSGTLGYEYYGVTGYTYVAGSAPQNTLMVYKLNTTGVIGTLTPTEFRYTLGYPFHPISYIGHAAITGIETGGGADDGIQAYGLAGRGNHYFVKAYFNGASGCNEVITDIDSVFQGLNTVGSLTISSSIQNQCNQLVIETQTLSITPSVACSSPTLAGGSNARFYNSISNEHQSELESFEIVRAYPNPVKDELNIILSPSQNLGGSIHCKLFDLHGRLVFDLSFRRKADNYYTLDLSVYKINPGLYRLEVFSEKYQERKQIKLIIEP